MHAMSWYYLVVILYGSDKNRYVHTKATSVVTDLDSLGPCAITMRYLDFCVLLLSFSAIGLFHDCLALSRGCLIILKRNSSPQPGQL